MEIKGIILDVDGVIVGDLPNINYPTPSQTIIEGLKKLNEKGIAIGLCTGRPYFGIEPILNKVQLTGPHTTNCGANISSKSAIKDSDSDANSIIEESLRNKILNLLESNKVYTEIYTKDEYFILKKDESDITNKHNLILQKYPILVDTFNDIGPIHKIMAIALNKESRNPIQNILRDIKGITLSWGTSPSSGSLQYGVITNYGITKSIGAKIFSQISKIPFENILGVGDSYTDLEFIKLCKYKATVENGSDRLKKEIRDNSGYIGPEVNDDGLIEILHHFRLL